MLPHEREMVKRLKGKPFTLLGINSDQGRSALKKKFEEQQITWPNIVEGSPGGSIAKQWNVRYWPTIYVIDRKGVIRAKDLRDSDLERAVNNLLDEETGEARHGPDAIKKAE